MSDKYDGDERREQPTAKPWERHLQSILTALVLAGILWLANTANENSRNIAILTVQVANMTEQIKEFKTSMHKASDDRFTGADGARLERRVERLEEELNNHFREGNGNGRASRP